MERDQKFVQRAASASPQTQPIPLPYKIILTNQEGNPVTVSVDHQMVSDNTNGLLEYTLRKMLRNAAESFRSRILSLDSSSQQKEIEQELQSFMHLFLKYKKDECPSKRHEASKSMISSSQKKNRFSSVHEQLQGHQSQLSKFSHQKRDKQSNFLRSRNEDAKRLTTDESSFISSQGSKFDSDIDEFNAEESELYPSDLVSFIKEPSELGSMSDDLDTPSELSPASNRKSFSQYF